MQPTLFDPAKCAASIDEVILYALGEFQARGHELVDRELALDRLHGAFVRAGDKFGIPAYSDEESASVLRKLGAHVVEIPAYFAKRPYRVTVPPNLAEDARNTYNKLNGKLS